MKVVEERQAHVHTHFAIGSLLVGVDEQLELLALSLKWETWHPVCMLMFCGSFLSIGMPLNAIPTRFDHVKARVKNNRAVRNIGNQTKWEP